MFSCLVFVLFFYIVNNFIPYDIKEDMWEDTSSPTPLLVLNHSDPLNLVLTQCVQLLYVTFTFSVRSGTFNILKVDQIFSLFILSYAFLKIYKYNYCILPDSQYFSITCLAVKAKSVMDLFHPSKRMLLLIECSGHC